MRTRAMLHPRFHSTVIDYSNKAPTRSCSRSDPQGVNNNAWHPKQKRFPFFKPPPPQTRLGSTENTEGTFIGGCIRVALVLRHSSKTLVHVQTAANSFHQENSVKNTKEQILLNLSELSLVRYWKRQLCATDVCLWLENFQAYYSSFRLISPSVLHEICW